jgi:hypothetical protein
MDLDIVCILISAIINPNSVLFNSGPFPVIDHQGRIHSNFIADGVGVLSVGSPLHHPNSTNKSQPMMIIAHFTFKNLLKF